MLFWRRPLITRMPVVCGCMLAARRMQTAADQVRNSIAHDVLFLDGGDVMTGTIWDTVYRGQLAPLFQNRLGVQAYVSRRRLPAGCLLCPAPRRAVHSAASARPVASKAACAASLQTSPAAPGARTTTAAPCCLPPILCSVFLSSLCLPFSLSFLRRWWATTIATWGPTPWPTTP